MAIALKTKHFKSPLELSAYCADAGNNVTTIVEIWQDSSGSWVLFYT